MKKILSCESLNSAVYFAPDVLRHCCKRFFVDGKMKGDVEIFKVSEEGNISYENIKKHKKELFKSINSGKINPCTGCPWLLYDIGPKLDDFKIKHISIEVQTICNLRCKYCSETYYGGKHPNYDILKVIKDLKAQGAISEDVSLVWGGGESTLLKDFDEIFSQITDLLNPKFNCVFTNAVQFKNILYEYLKDSRITTITSIDAGTPEMFKIIRGADKLEDVLLNLQRYASVGGGNLIIKYILTEETSSEKELSCFVDNVFKYELDKCTFQISTDFKAEDITIKIMDSAYLLYKMLEEKGIELINFDDHLKPRIKKSFTSDAQILEPIIIWGAGEYARRLLQNDEFFTRNKVKFFVDKNPEKQDRNFFGYQVKAPEEILKDTESRFFIASSLHFREIYEELVVKMGIVPKRIINNPLL